MSDPNEHAPYFKNLLGDAKKGGANLVDQEETQVNNASGQHLTAGQLASTQNLRNILNSIKQNSNDQQGYDHWEPRQEKASIVPEDINKNPNYTNEPVYYHRNGNTAGRISHLPYAVSDVVVTCKKCTYYKECGRHRPRDRSMKTDISLCTKNHLRMALYWDITDPENRKASWKLGIEEKFDRFLEPDQEKIEHEEARNDKGCKPQESFSRVKSLAQRIIEDYNQDQADKARRAYLDPKGREYYTHPKHWGAKDPFEPAEGSKTRKGHEFKSADGCRVERELRVLLQAWYKSQVPEHRKGKDRTTEKANKIWAEKVEARKILKDLQNAGRRVEGGEKVVGTASRSNEKVEKKRKRKTAEATRDDAKSTADTQKPVKESQSHRPILDYSDESDEGKIIKQPVRKTGTLKTSSQNGRPDSIRETRKPSQTRIPEPAAPSPKDLARFEKLAHDIEDEEAAKNTPPVPVRELAEPPGMRSGLRLTDDENKIQKELKGKAYAEEDDEPIQEDAEGEESEDDSEAEVPAKRKKSIKDILTKKRTTVKRTKSSTDESSPPPLPPTKPKSNPKPKAEKRKTPASSTTDLPVAKKSRKTYKSADIIEDSDEEANYDLPAAPALALPQQREGWKLAEEVGAEGVKVVQTDEVGDEVEEGVVVEQGTTIVKHFHGGGESEGDVDEEILVEQRSANVEQTIQEQESEDGESEMREVLAPLGKPASADSEAEEVEVTATQSPVGSPAPLNEAGDVVSPTGSPSEHSDASQDSLFEDCNSPPVPPSLSPKRKYPPAESESDEDEDEDEDDEQPAKKKAKSVKWADKNGEFLTQERKLSIEYILNEEGGERNEDEGSDEKEGDRASCFPLTCGFCLFISKVSSVMLRKAIAGHVG